MSDFKAKMYQILNPEPPGGAYSAPPDPLAGLRGPTSKWGDGMGRGRERDGEGREGTKGEGWDPTPSRPPQSIFLDMRPPAHCSTLASRASIMYNGILVGVRIPLVSPDTRYRYCPNPIKKF